jgi:hypothetical protein
MENNPKKSRALLITIIIIIIFIIIAFLIYRNRDMFGVKTSATISKIFSPLIPSINEGSRTALVQAGEDINKGDSVSLIGKDSNNNPIVAKTKDGDKIFGYANQNINNGDIGSITLTPNLSNSFFNSFANFLNNLFNGNNNNQNMPPGGWSFNGNLGIWEFDPNGIGGWLFDPNTGGWVPPGSGNYKPQCSDGVDNDADGLIDVYDPNCHIDGDLEKDYIPSHNSESSSPVGGVDIPPGVNLNPQCSDTIDNDLDQLIDDADPNCHIDGDLEKDYIPSHNSESSSPVGGDNLPDLTAGPVTPNNALLNTPINLFSEITNIGEKSTLINFTSYFAITKTNPNIINPNSGNVSKSIFKKVLSKISLKINNAIANDKVEISVIVPTLQAKAKRTIQVSHTFPTIGIYYVRTCADKSSSNNNGTIVESNENNNCGPWSMITVSSSLPPPSQLPQCSDGIDNDKDGKIDILDPNCHIDGDLNKAYVPSHNSESNSPGIILPDYECSDGIDNDKDGKIDILDPNCHIDGDLNKAYVPSHNSEKNSPNIPIGNPNDVNKCALIEKNPPIFTDEERARLDVLLRKFYLISSNLRTTDDIVTIYSEIEQYKDFISQIDGLNKQCYLQTNSLEDYIDFCNRNNGLCFNGDFEKYANKNYKSGESGGQTSTIYRRGNPWFSKGNNGPFPYSNTVGGYIDYNHFEGGRTLEGCKVVSGYYYGEWENKAKNQIENCSIFNYTSIPNNFGSCSTAATQRTGNFTEFNQFKGTPPLKNILDLGCKWKEGVYFDAVEKLINMW